MRDPQAARGWGRVCAAVAAACCLSTAAFAASLDADGEMELGVRAYTAVRVGTEHTDVTIKEQAPGRQTFRSLTFPVSAAGHLRQHRYFIEVTLQHDLDRLLDEGFGPLALLKALPFRIRKFGYFLSYRGEGEGVYDYGPREYRTATQFRDQRLVPESPFGGAADVGAVRRRLRRIGTQRQRLFQAYIQGEAGGLFVRIGRQILAWGETDAFRLLDNINPLDSSFGGFLVPLDERRVPLDMLRLNYYIGAVPGTPLYEMYIEAFAALDDDVGFLPGVPTGSPWALPGFGVPGKLTAVTGSMPARTLPNVRGGFQVKFIVPAPGIEEATVSFVHYYTYPDLPAVEVFAQGDQQTGMFFPFPIQQGSGAGFMALAEQTAARMRITGGTATFALPPRWAQAVRLSGEPIVRMELAYFKGEPRYTQSQLDPFVFALSNCTGGNLTGTGLCSGGRRTGDSWNVALGLDTTQWIHFLNKHSTFVISTQFFYRHMKNPVKRRRIATGGAPLPGQSGLFDGEILPVPASIESPDRWGLSVAAVEPIFVHNPTDQFLQTLLFSTSYLSGQVIPTLSLFYDWAGAVVAQPQVTFIRDPFRLTVSYSYLESSKLRGASGISLLRDRDNVLFQLEYAL